MIAADNTGRLYLRHRRFSKLSVSISRIRPGRLFVEVGVTFDRIPLSHTYFRFSIFYSDFLVLAISTIDCLYRLLLLSPDKILSK